MRKKLLTILTTVIMAAALAACSTGNRQEQAEEDASVYDEEEYDEGREKLTGKTEEAGADSRMSAVSLSNALEAAVCDYLLDSGWETDDPGRILIPGFIAADADVKDPEDVRIPGDFWYMAYDWQQDTLTSGEGREFSGVLHFQEEDGKYTFKRKEVLSADAGEEAAKRLFGNSYTTWKRIHSDYALREETRAQMIADYVGAFGFSAARYRDYGWDPMELPDPDPDWNNIFYYMLHRGEMADISELVVSSAAEEVRQEEVYVVKRGDTLSKIAGAYGISTTELAERNRDTIIRAARSQGIMSEDLMRCANYIFPGEILAVPVK